MKKFFSFVSAILVAGTMCAQTITIDGDNADWAEVPMLTEPGVGPVVKIIIPQEGVGTTLPEDAAFTVMVEGDHEQVLAGYPVIYTDADKSTATGGKAWYCPSFGKDYELATWSEGTWFSQNAAGSVREMCLTKAAFTSVPFTGELAVWLTFNWGALVIPKFPDQNTYMVESKEEPQWKWGENQYHPFDVKPYTYANVAGTHTAAATYSTHEALLPGETLELSKGGFDTEFWASWAVELKEPTVYNVSINANGTNTTSVDLWLVDVATNEVVAERAGEDIWAPEGETTYGTWDLSAVPAGKYMLKLKNHVQWSTVVFNSVTFTVGSGETTALENTTIETTSKKVIENGQIYIIRGNERFNVLGTSVR